MANHMRSHTKPVLWKTIVTQEHKLRMLEFAKQRESRLGWLGYLSDYGQALPPPPKAELVPIAEMGLPEEWL